MTVILKDKVAVITGGSRGLGFAIAEVYAREGAKIVIASRSLRSVDEAVKKLKLNGAQVIGQACDVADMQQVESLAELAVNTFGRIDIWVNNAGLSAPYGPDDPYPKRRLSLSDQHQYYRYVQRLGCSHAIFPRAEKWKAAQPAWPR